MEGVMYKFILPTILIIIVVSYNLKDREVELDETALCALEMLHAPKLSDKCKPIIPLILRSKK
jgi:hypothetical protein